MHSELSDRNKIQLINKILGELIFPIGFARIKQSNFSTVEYFRKYRDVGQKLEICLKKDKDDYVNVRAILSYSITIPCLVLTTFEERISEIPADERFDDGYYGWRYVDEETFIKTLKIIRKHLALYFIPELNKRSEMPDKERVTTRNYMYLSENLIDIIVLNRKSWNLDGKTIESQLGILSEKIVEVSHENFIDIETKLADIAAVYGDIIIKHLKGKWIFIEFHNSVLIDDISERKVYTYPLQCTIDMWCGKGNLFDDYNRIKAEIVTANPSHRCKKTRNLERVDYKINLV